ncbi:MAG: chemotaxis protein CheW [Pseudomonadota bacterium]
MHSFDNANPKFTISTMFARTRFLRVRALGEELAFDAASVCNVIDLADVHIPVRFGHGLAMFYEGRIIPLVDYRAPSCRGTAMTGVPLVVANVQRSLFALAVDCIREQVSVEYAEICQPERVLVDRCPYLAGSIRRGASEVYLVDLERLLGPAIRTHLSGQE